MLNRNLGLIRDSAQRWFNCQNVGPSPHLRAFHSTASDGTRVFVLGGNSPNAREDEVSLIHVFDTSMYVCFVKFLASLPS